MNNRIHVVAFQQPFPPSYGGAIDMYFRIKALHDLGLHVILHTYRYGERLTPSNELKEISSEICYYKRHTGWKSQLSTLPYIVYSRRNDCLLENLCRDDAPILFEGLHTTFYLNHPRLRSRFKIVRAHNIEHEYYKALALAPGKISDRMFFALEACKLKAYEKILRHADLIAPLNHNEMSHFMAKFPETPVHFTPVFFDETPAKVSGNGNYVLYHGNLTVAENVKAAKWIIENIATAMPGTQFIIAGKQPPAILSHAVRKTPNVKLISSPDNAEMTNLIDKAKVHLLITFQATGVKLKLLNVLLRRGKVVANSLMVSGTGLECLCNIGNSPEDIAKLIRQQFITTGLPPSLPEIYHSATNATALLKQVPYYRDFINHTDSIDW